MATLLDTSAVAVLIRRRSAPHEAVAAAARSELLSGHAILSVVSATELLVGARDARGGTRLENLIAALIVVPVDLETALLAGRLGAYVRGKGAAVPIPDLLIAATAIRLDVPLLTTDGDFMRGRRIAADDTDPDRTAHLWRSLRFHPTGA